MARTSDASKEQMQMKRAIRSAVLATAIGSLMACSGSSPAAPAPPANIAGLYNATVTASSTCSAKLPSETRVLNYSADVSQTGATAQVQITPHGGSQSQSPARSLARPSTFRASRSAQPRREAVFRSCNNRQSQRRRQWRDRGHPQRHIPDGIGNELQCSDHQLQMRRCVVTCAGNVCACL